MFSQLSIVTSNPIYFSYNVAKTLVLKPYIQLNVIRNSTADINGDLLSISFLCVQVSVLGYSREASSLCPGLHSTGCITNGQKQSVLGLHLIQKIVKMYMTSGSFGFGF